MTSSFKAYTSVATGWLGSIHKSINPNVSRETILAAGWLHLDEFLSLGTADGAILRRCAKFDVAAEGTEVKLCVSKISALLNGFKGPLVNVGMDFFCSHGETKHTLGPVPIGLRLL